MKCAAFILAAAAAAAGMVAAAPGTKLLPRNYSSLAPRSARSRYSSAPKQKLAVDSPGVLKSAGTAGEKNADYSGNWAGAIKNGKGYNHVTGTITVPKVSGARGAAASAWVGIDGDTCQTAILQTGISFYADGTFDAWYEWLPDYAYSFTNFGVSVGDQVRMTVDASSKTRGVATIKNLTTGQQVTHRFTRAPSPLCETNAEWVVEAFQEDGKQVTLVNFGTVTFKNAAATGSGGSVSAAGAGLSDISANSGQTVLAASSVNGSTVTVKYVG
ncbi:Aspergillopepsin-2 [Colletotrichum tanaceti]|uniref:Aspergillopepsin-2 n=1 Tax=Colletotrichum tanaceti TaxID=1306861 RepID=A0A4U6X508_9PEZI|nr:Aspergillopepsin-2 [Colletotrichum tanaceti]TKW50033.1 Aspergillopepsin-2 [Colletotrichum tanaceti]